MSRKKVRQASRFLNNFEKAARIIRDANLSVLSNDFSNSFTGLFANKIDHATHTHKQTIYMYRLFCCKVKYFFSFIYAVYGEFIN